MKKLITLILFISLSFNLYSQEVNVEIDEFTGKKTVSTSWERLNTEFDLMTSAFVYYQFINNPSGVPILRLAFGSNDGAYFKEGSKVQLKFNNDNIITLINIDNSFTTMGGAKEASSFWMTEIPGVIVKYLLTENIENDAKNYFLTDLRRHYTSSDGSTYTDTKIKKNDAKKFQKTYKMFIDEINKTSE